MSNPIHKNHAKEMKKLSVSTHKLLQEYQAKHFEYISYKDFCRLLKGLEEINHKIEELRNDQN